ncbi:flavodoxin reductase [Oceanicola sp. 22II-s10i]|uniref:FAD-binding oxidoreductase n=1 Tax=Oceanicola sp. 22II-s10i TaxID=1317116 RepID=UPI000B522B00|nr:FAD-binding oxidoreductase [Oceanicola sp. 22II-s10i]OWU85771.1 flavodoxin reductase [Oceanicola sp. 22II-s10i]
MTHTLTLKTIEPVTPDTYHLVFDRPKSLSFQPGQGVDLALDRDGWRDEARPFTPVSLPDEPTLDFVIKSYPDHDGVTKRIARMEPGDRVVIDDPWGAIRDEGPGVFIAGGAGVTPFIAILRQRLADEGTLEGCRLIFSNATEADIILRDEFEDMDGLECVFTVTDQPDAGVETSRIDRDFLERHVEPDEGVFYVCGPDEMIEDVVAALRALGVEDERIVTEDFD